MIQRSLSSYLSRLFFISLTPLIMLSCMLAFYIIHEQQKDTKQQAQLLADNIANNIDNYLDSRTKALKIIAHSPYIFDRDKHQELYNEARAFRLTYDSHVILVDALSSPMRMLFNTRVPFTQSLPPLPSPQGGLGAVKTALKTKLPAVGDTFHGPLANESLVAIAMPVSKDTSVQYLVINIIETRLIQERIDTVAMPRDWGITLTDSKGDIIAYTSGSYTSHLNDTDFEKISVSPSLTSWNIDLVIPKSYFLAPFIKAFGIFAALIPLTALIGFLVGKTASTRLGRQVAAVAEHGANEHGSNIIEIAEVEKTIKEKEVQLIEGERKYKELFKSNPNPMWIYDIETFAFLEVNNAALDKYGYSQAEFLNKTIKDIRPKEDVNRLVDNVASISGGFDDAGIWRHITKSGRIIFVQITSHTLSYDGRKAELVSANDVTEKVLAEEMLQRRAKQHAILAELGLDVVKAEDSHSLYKKVSLAAVNGLRANQCVIYTKPSALPDYKANELYGWHTESVHKLLKFNDLPSNVKAAIDSSQPITLSNFTDLENESYREIYISENVNCVIAISSRTNSNSNIIIAAYSNDEFAFSIDDKSFLQSLSNTLVTALNRQEINEKLGFMAMHDGLTKLPNRRLLTDRFDLITAHSNRSEKPIALLFLDLDRFKNLNDVFGHSVGDQVLKEIAQRLERCMRGTDTVSRQGGDEFLILLSEMEHQNDIIRVSEKILKTITYPIQIQRTEIVLSGSIGIACYPDDGHDLESLMRSADTAMYHAKNTGRNRFEFYSKDMNERLYERLKMESELHHAINKEQLFIVYQPQFNLSDNTLIGAEALVRWQHPIKGLIPPGEFVPLAEELGLIQEIGIWVMENACCQFNEWISENLFPGTVAVNVSGYQFQQSNFVDVVKSVLEKSGLPAQHLELEVTESVVMYGYEMVVAKLRELYQLGVKIAIDDFGTGYSSLSYLQNFPIHRLKIDKSFVDGVPGNHHSCSIVESVIQLGHGLELDVLAEGIETPAQQNFLVTASCESGQGYLFSKPLDANHFQDMLLRTSIEN